MNEVANAFGLGSFDTGSFIWLGLVILAVVALVSSVFQGNKRRVLNSEAPLLALTEPEEFAPEENDETLVERRIKAALASNDPVFVNEVACELSELTHFETLNNAFHQDERSQQTIRRHASAVVQLLHHQRELLQRGSAAS